MTSPRYRCQDCEDTVCEADCRVTRHGEVYCPNCDRQIAVYGD